MDIPFFSDIWNNMKWILGSFQKGITGETDDYLRATNHADQNQNVLGQMRAMNQWQDWEDQGMLNKLQSYKEERNFDYQKALQQQIFAREDTALTRRVQDAQNAGLSPLAGLDGAGAGSVVPISSPSAGSGTTMAEKSAQLMQSMQMMDALRTGQVQRGYLSAQADKLAADTEYQNAVTDYFREHKTLPTQSDKRMEYLMQLLNGLMDKDYTNLTTLGSDVKEAVSSAVRSVAEELNNTVQELTHPGTEWSGNHGSKTTVSAAPSSSPLSAVREDINKYGVNLNGLSWFELSDDGKSVIFHLDTGGTRVKSLSVFKKTTQAWLEANAGESSGSQIHYLYSN